MDLQSWDALIEIHRQGIVVGSLLGGFAMSSAFSSFVGTWDTRVDKYLSLAALISSASLICMVCISALVLFAFGDIGFRLSQKLPIESFAFLGDLSAIALILGALGLFSLLVMFALMGWEKGLIFGVCTTVVALSAGAILMKAFFVVYYGYQLPNYGELPYLPGL